MNVAKITSNRLMFLFEATWICRCFPSLSDRLTYRKNFASRNLSDFYIVILGMTQEDVV